MRAVSFVLLVVTVLTPTLSSAQTLPRDTPERTLPMDQVIIEDVKIEGLVQAWKFRKVCIDRQAYWLILGASGPTSITASFKDGKPEPCTPQALVK